MGPGRRIAVGALVLSAAVACSVVTSYEGFTPDGRPPVPCGKVLPARPLDAPLGDEIELFGAAKAFSFLEPADAGTQLGYNLDGLCTCYLDPSPCRPYSAAVPCDPPGGSGIDNAAGQIVTQLYRGQNTAFGVDEGIASGRHGVFVRLRDWNGKSNDSHAVVALFNVSGVVGDRAEFNGEDRFFVAQEGPVGFLAKDAYVANDVLVADLDGFDLRLTYSQQVPDAGPLTVEVRVPLSSATFVGRMERVGDSGLRIVDAQVVGRLRERDVFAQLPRVGICQDDARREEYAGIKKALCNALDITVGPHDENGEKTCDALSFVVGLRVEPAKLEGEKPLETFPSLCPAPNADKCP